MPVVLLRGGSRDGESTSVDEHVMRLYATSEAPGMVDVYEVTDESVKLAGTEEGAIVYRFTDQEPITDTTVTHLQMPAT
jgi:hypothetical protein